MLISWKTSLFSRLFIKATLNTIQESRAYAVLITEEITRVKQIWASATNRFQGHFEDDDEDTENEDDDEDYYEMIDLPIDNDCEIFQSECDE